MPAEAPLLLLRADAGPGIGSGHAARLLSLAEAWVDAGGRARLLTHSPSPALRMRAGSLGVEVSSLPSRHPDPADLAETKAALVPGSWIAVDGYHFDAPYLSALRAAGAKVLRVDDSPKGPVPCDAFLDHTPGAEYGAPDVPPEALPLLGPRWALTRSAFAAAGDSRAPREGTPRLLVSFGGWDPSDATGLALRAIKRLKSPVEAVVVVGPDNPKADSYATLAAGLPVRLERNADMPTLMAWADAALLNGGVTSLEALAAGLPMANLVLVDNQEPGARALDAAGIAPRLGRADAVAENDLAAAIDSLLSASPGLRGAGRRLCDGRGAARTAATLIALSEPKLAGDWTRLRPAEPEDCVEIWRIANDPAVRANSFRKESIPLEGHRAWYESTLKDPASRLWVLEVGAAIAGSARYTLRGSEAEVHFSVRGAFRGKGLGTFALSETRALACRDLGAKKLTGFVITPNEPSERSFLSAGWAKRGVETRDGAACAVFEASCS